MASPAAPAAEPQKTAKEIEDAIMMPPPPNPTVKVILEPEMNALSDALKNIVAQTGLVYRIYAASRKQVGHIQAPQSVTAALGREIERYDQLCDSLEARVLRAVAVLQRDLTREKRRIEDEQLALKTKEQEENRAATTPERQGLDLSLLKAEATLLDLPNSSPVSTHSAGRRPSAVSISSLHRPSLPGKLDLSSASFRISTAEEGGIFQSGLASPVTLAPKSARALGPNELPNDFMSAFGSEPGVGAPDIDLTLPDVIHDTSQTAIDLSVGDSSDKPIELDMDMVELFGEDPDSAGPSQESDNLFSPVDSVAEASQGNADFLANSQSNNMLSALTAGVPNSSEGDDLSKSGSLLASFPSPNQQEGLGNAESEDFNFGQFELEFFSESQPATNFPMEFEMNDAILEENATKDST